MRNIKDNSKTIISQQEVKYLDILLKNSSKQQLDYINHMIDRGNNFPEITESQRSISKRIKVPRRSVSRLSTTVSQKGLVIKKSRGRNGVIKNTCQYILPEIWEDPDIRKRYKHILPALQISKRYSSIQSVKNSKYLSYKIIQTASVAYISVSSCIISLNKVSGDTNMHIKNEHGICKNKKVKFQSELSNRKVRKKMVEAEKGFNEIAQKYLEAYPKEAVKYATRKIHGRTLTGDAWLYYKKILNEWCTKNNVEPDYSMLNGISGLPRLTLPIPQSSVIAQSPTSFQKKQEEKKPYAPTKAWQKPTEPEIKVKTAVELAECLAQLSEQSKTNQFAHYAIKAISRENYTKTGEDNEEMAVLYIEKKRKEYGTHQELAEYVKEIEARDKQERPNHQKYQDLEVEPTSIMQRLAQVLPKETADYLKNATKPKSTIPQPTYTPEFKPESTTINEDEFEEVINHGM